jgi:hypothetical protein
MLHYPSTKTEREMKHVLPCIPNKNTCHFIKQLRSYIKIEECS